MGIWNNDRYFIVAGGLPNCTTYVRVRCEEENLPVPSTVEACDWPENLSDGWSVVYTGPGGSAPIQYGDVVISKKENHVCFVNNDGTVSGSGYMHDLYLEKNYDHISPGITYRGNKSFWVDVSSNGWIWNGYNLNDQTWRPSKDGSEWYRHAPTRYYFYHKNALTEEWGGTGTVYVLRYNGTPSGPGDGDEGGGGSSGGESGGQGDDGHYETRTISLNYSTEYECGTGLVSGQTGSQDAPLAPVQMDGNPDGTRKNERWEPFNMYTYERTLTYDKDNNPVWSNWELKYSGSQTLTLGEQPSYGNGWEMDWGDE